MRVRESSWGRRRRLCDEEGFLFVAAGHHVHVPILSRLYFT